MLFGYEHGALVPSAIQAPAVAVLDLDNGLPRAAGGRVGCKICLNHHSLLRSKRHLEVCFSTIAVLKSN